MNVLIIVIMVVFNFVLQSTILPSLSIFGVVPNTALIFIIFVSLNKGRYYGGFLGLAIGLIQDIIFGTTIGINGFIYFFIGFILGYLEEDVARDSIIMPAICSIFATIFYNFMYFLFMFFLSRGIPFGLIMKEILLVEIIYNTLLTIIVFKIMGKVFVEPSLRFGKR